MNPLELSLFGRTRTPAISRHDAVRALARVAALTAAGMTTGDALAASARRKARSGSDACLARLAVAVRRGHSLSTAMAGLSGADVGIPLWAMHSARETAHLRDQDAMIALVTELFG